MPANYVLLQRIELNASAASVTFSNIPQSGYTDLKIVGSTRQSGSADGNQMGITFNGSSSGYSRKVLLGDGANAQSYSGSSEAYTRVSFAQSSTYTANTFNNFEVYIPNYTSASNKSFSSDAVTENSATTSYASINAGLWSNTAAITSITLSEYSGSSTSFVKYSTFSLYGLAATGTTPAIAPKATGGNITSDGTYWIHTFNSTGTFTPATSLTCDYLVVAGGGGGGATSGGGGGAGGFRTATSQSLTAIPYTVTIGAGGAGSTANASKGSNGADSVFSSTTSTGGGGGGSASSVTGANGGSGGGSHAINSAGTASPSGQGNNGGSGYTDAATYNSGGGGGGASSAGTAATSNKNGGAGGSGTANSYSGSSVTYAGGGGGGTNGAVGGAGAAGGSGGGGTGASDNNSRTTPYGSSPGTAGTANTGGGGGGGASNGYGDLFYGQSGGSGIVIIRYAMA